MNKDLESRNYTTQLYAATPFRIEVKKNGMKLMNWHGGIILKFWLH